MHQGTQKEHKPLLDGEGTQDRSSGAIAVSTASTSSMPQSPSLEHLYQPQFDNLEDLQRVTVPVQDSDVVIDIPEEDETETGAEEETEMSSSHHERRKARKPMRGALQPSDSRLSRRVMKAALTSGDAGEDDDNTPDGGSTTPNDNGYDDDDEDDLTEYDAESDHPTTDDDQQRSEKSRSRRRVREYFTPQLHPKMRLRRKLMARHLKGKKFALPSQVMAAKKEVAMHHRNTRLQMALNMARKDKMQHIKQEMHDTLKDLEKKIQTIKEAKAKGMLVNDKEYLQYVKKQKWIEKRLKGFSSTDLARTSMSSTSWVWRYLTGRGSLPPRNPVSWRQLAAEDKVEVKNLIIDLVWAFLSFGMPAYRLDYAITMTATFYGLDAEISVTPYHFFVAFHDFLIDDDEVAVQAAQEGENAAAGAEGMFSYPSTISLTSLEKEWNNMTQNVESDHSRRNDDEDPDQAFFGRDVEREKNLYTSDDDDIDVRRRDGWRDASPSLVSGDVSPLEDNSSPFNLYQDDTAQHNAVNGSVMRHRMLHPRHTYALGDYESDDESGYSATSELASPVTEHQEDTHEHSSHADNRVKRPNKRQKHQEDTKHRNKKQPPADDNESERSATRPMHKRHHPHDSLPSRRGSVVGVNNVGGSSTMAPTIEIKPTKCPPKRPKHYAEMSFLMCNSTHFVKVKSSSMDLQKVIRLEQLCHLLYNGFISIKEARERLKQILRMRHIYTYAPVHFIANVTAAIGFSTIMGANWAEMVSVAVGSIVCTLIELILTRLLVLFSKLMLPVNAIVAGLLGVLMRFAFKNTMPINVFLVGLCVVINYLPGYSFVTSIAEISEKKNESGILRLSAVAMTLLQLGFGLVIGSSLNNVITWEKHFSLEPHVNPLWMQVLGLLLAIFSWGLSFKIPINILTIVYIELAAVAVFFTQFLMLKVTTTMGANFSGGLISGLSGQIYSWITGHPSIVCTAVILLPLVPGSSGVRAAAAWGDGNVVGAVEHMMNGVAIATAIVIGFMVGRLLIPTATRTYV